MRVDDKVKEVLAKAKKIADTPKNLRPLSPIAPSTRAQSVRASCLCFNRRVLILVPIRLDAVRGPSGARATCKAEMSA